MAVDLNMRLSPGVSVPGKSTDVSGCFSRSGPGSSKGGVDADVSAIKEFSRSIAGGPEKQVFLSAAHQAAVRMVDLSSDAFSRGSVEQGNSLLHKAMDVAFSMGESGRYGENPFSSETQAQLNYQFQAGANERQIQREMQIGGEKDADMSL